MRQADERTITRGGMLRALIGGAVVAGGATVAARGGAEDVLAAPSHALDKRIMQFVLTVELVQAGFYEAAIEARKLDGELLQLALAVREQERRHAAFVQDWLKGDAGPPPRTNFGGKLSSPDNFLKAAIDLEEAAIAGYLGQAAHLTKATMSAAATLVSVEARQVAWLRDLANVSPAPRAADPPRKPEDVMAFLRDKGYLA
jgi:rubrerythrin